LVKRVYIFLFILFFPAFLLGQGGGPPKRPEPPEIDYVSVDTATGYVYISWKPSPSDTLDRYIIWEWQEIEPGFSDSAFFEVGNVGSDTLEFWYQGMDVGKKPSTSTVAASWDGWDPSPLADAHTTIHLTLKYDSCAKNMELDWTPYVGWDPADYVKHKVFVSIDNGSYQKIGETDDTVYHFVQNDIEDNRSYCYLVEAIRKDGIGSFSNEVCKFTDYLLHPLWIDAEQASTSGGDQVSMDFYIEESGEVTTFQLLKSDKPGIPFSPIEIFTDVNGPILSYTDNVVSTDKQYQYKLYSLDVCSDTIVGSNITGNIVLQANSVSLQAFLSWTPYTDYEAGVKSYQIYRILNMGDPQAIGEVYAPDTAFTDNLDFVSGSDIEDEICYYVVAGENEGYTRGLQGYSQSNTTCISITPKILMPNAFTPNDDGRNDIIKPVLTFIPQKFIFQVFDRWGSRIFETTDPENGWNGSVNGGGKASEGVYIYYILLTTTRGIEVEQRGEITLFYP